MEQISTGVVEVTDAAVAAYTLTRTYQPRPIAVPIGGGRTEIVDRGSETQAYIAFHDIRSTDFRARLQAMINAVHGGLDARRRLRDARGNVIAVTLHEIPSGMTRKASVSVAPPVGRTIEETEFPVVLLD